MLKTAFRYAAKVWGYYLIMALICLLFVSGIDNNALRIGLNALMLLAFLGVAVNDGGYNGEKAATLSASIEKQRADGRRIAADSIEQVWSKKTGVNALVICLLPLLLIAGINVAVAPMFPAALVEDVQTVQSEPEPAATQRPVIVPSGSATQTNEAINYMAILARFIFMPFVSVYSMVSAATLNWLFFLFALPMPFAQFIGYMMGPRLREKKLKDIAMGKRRKMRNLKVHKQPKPPKAEV